MNPPTHPTTTTSTSIEDLPPEMISELFSYLPLKDLVICSMVNKRWHSIYAAFKLHRLFVIDYRYVLDFCKWYSKQTIPEEEWCSKWMLVRLVEKPLLSNLRHLVIVVKLTSRIKFDFNKLNRFPELVHLEIDIVDFHGEINLNLFKLKVLALQGFDYRCALSIDCPRLSTLIYKGQEANLLEVKQPETIRKLDTNMVGLKLAQFKSIECLVTRNFQAINQATLRSFPRLRELYYDQNIEFAFKDGSNDGIDTIDRMMRTMSEFLDEAKKLRGSDFRFTFAGFPLHKVNADQIDFGVPIHGEHSLRKISNEYIYVKNYQLTEPGALRIVSYTDYSRLLGNVTREFP